MTQTRPAADRRHASPPRPVPRRRVRPDVVTWLSVYLLLLFVIPSKLVIGPLGSAGAPSMVVGLASLLLWVLTGVGAARPRLSGPRLIRVSLALFLFSVGVTYVIAMSRPVVSNEMSPADVAILALLAWSGVLLLAHDGITSTARRDVLVWRLALASGALAVLGLAQFVLGELLVDRLALPGLTLTAPYELGERNGLIRPQGTATHAIEYGVLVTMLLPLTLHVGFEHTERRPLVRWAPAAATLVLVPLSGSRSAYVGAAIGLVILLLGWKGSRRKIMLGVTAVGALAGLVVAPGMLSSILGLFTGASEDPSVTSRTGSFDLAGEFIARDPLFGRGLGTFLPTYRIFDNQYLLLLVTVGLVGTVLFLGIGAATVRVLMRVRRRAAGTDARTYDLALALTASVVVGFVSLLFFDAFAFPMTMGALFLLVGVAGSLRARA
ncbi:O-antigen ligase family protein [Promicromonospora sp. NPDC059942]|uniref:O-antigen ligase family protein n=1 Tax=Promicromonospora sp. NPDC059942 TaxID=3347009 RepID=UPI00364C6CFF